MFEEASEQHGIDPASKPLASVDEYNRHTLVVLTAQLEIGVDVDLFNLETVRNKKLFCLFAQTTLPA